MASLFSSPQFLSLPKTRGNNHFPSSSQFSPRQHLSLNSTEPPPPAAAAEKAAAAAFTRRSGIGAGLAFLAVGVASQQIKRDVEKEEEVVLPNGIRYYELRAGGGSSPTTGDLVVIDARGSVQGNGEAFVDTFGNRAMALVMGPRPHRRGICEGLEYALRDMKVGGKMRVSIPPNLGFGERGVDLGEGLQIPPLATLEYIVELHKVSSYV